MKKFRIYLTPTLEIDLIPYGWRYKLVDNYNPYSYAFKWLFIRLNIERKI